MKDENGEMQQVSVEVGVDNDNYVAILSGLKDGDTVYKQVETKASSAGGLMGIFSSLGGGMQMPGGGMDFGGGGGMDFGNMPSGFGGGGSGGGGGFGGR